MVKLVTVETFDFLRHRHILLVWAALFGLGVIFSIRAQGDLKNITRYLNIVGAVLLLTTVVSIGTLQIGSAWALQGPESSNQVSPAATIDDSGDRPDIYFIMLDAYATSRSLKNNMGFNNHEFIDHLESQDFYIPSGGRSNYTNTTLSMASAMNMNLLDDVADLNPGDSDDPSALIEMTRNGEVMDFL